jgi:dTMP kinase
VTEPGKFITLEGGEGAGKSTQSTILLNRLVRAGRRVAAAREPGGSPEGERIREALLSGAARDYGPFAEALLFAAARQSHVETLIEGKLADGTWVVCDRFIDSTRAYQGGAGGVPRPVLAALERLTLKGIKPDLTLILDLPPEEGLARAVERAGGEGPDRFESQDLYFHERVRRAYLDIAEEEPRRCVVINARQTEDMVAEDIWEAVSTRLSP